MPRLRPDGRRDQRCERLRHLRGAAVSDSAFIFMLAAVAVVLLALAGIGWIAALYTILTFVAGFLAAATWDI